MEGKLFTVADADRLLAQVRPLAEQLRAAAREAREAEAALRELVERHGEGRIDQPGNPDRGRYWALVARAREASERTQGFADDIQFLGAEVKDPEQGLVDFRTRRDGEVVYLCWRLGEARIAYWHDLRSGYAGRRPIGELEQRKG